MEFIVFLLAIVTLGHLIFSVLELKVGLSKIKPLLDQEALPSAQLPFVSIILSALNEEECVEKSIVALTALDYPHFEIIAINDRSTDYTPAILDKLQSQYPDKLRVFHIHKLPEDWLGKNHALQFAASKACGEWLLFTDADVLMKPSSVSKALSYALLQKIDHLTIYEHHIRKSFWLKILLLGSYATYILAMKPWRVRVGKSKKALGHGAFNLVKKSVYWAVGGHKSIALECLDDLMLGRLLKSRGFHQDVVNGSNLIEREWYSSAWGMINGLKKNSFAFFNFNLWTVCRDFCFALCYYIWPIVGIFIYEGPIRWLNIANVLLTGYIISGVAKQFKLHPGFALFYPISIIMLLYTVWHSVFSTYKNNGIVWRETHYSLEKLKYKNSAINEE